MIKWLYILNERGYIMKIYLVVKDYSEDIEILEAFKTEEKAMEFIVKRCKKLKDIALYYSIHKMEVK